MQAYPIRGQVRDYALVLRGTLSNTQVLTKTLTFESLHTTSFNRMEEFIIGTMNGGYVFQNRDGQYLAIQDGSLVYSDLQYPIPLNSLSIDRQVPYVVAGAFYSTIGDSWRFLPTLLYVGGSAEAIEGETIVNIERNLVSYSDSLVNYFTSIPEARDNMLYRYDYGGVCTSIAKGACLNTAYTGDDTIARAGLCQMNAENTGWTCLEPLAATERIATSNSAFLIAIVVALIVVGLIVATAFIISSLRRNPNETGILDSDDWH